MSTVRPLPTSLVETIKKGTNIHENQLISIRDLPQNIQQQIKESSDNDCKQSNAFLIKVPTNSNSINAIKVYFNGKAINNELEKQRGRVKLLKNERNRLQEINKKTNKNLKRDQKLIDILHQYNEIRDKGLQVMGRLNQIRGTVSSELYDEFGLNLTD